MSEAGKRVQARREFLGISQVELAQIMGVSRITIGNWEDGTTKKLPGDKLPLLAVTLKTSINHILEGGDPDSYEDEPEITDPNAMPDFASIPVYGVKLSAGPGAEIGRLSKPKSYLHFSVPWLWRIGLHRRTACVMGVTGDSMEPVLYSGDSVLLDTSDGAKKIVDGMVYAIGIGEDARVKRIKIEPTSGLVICGDNPRERPSYVSREEISSVRILGRVVHKMGSGGLIPKE